MKLPDVNVLLYAANADSPRHRPALEWLERAFASSGGVAFAWVVLLGFIRISTTPGILAQPIGTATAFKFIRAWLSQPNTHVVHPTDRHETLLASLLLAAGKAGNLTTDAHLAALAIEHGATLASFDRDFDRFDGLNFERLRA
jgi:toxin-antitoxin system PIN domain toxin